ncbi:MAG: Ig-like domain-containing protein [Duganella sp.]
MEPRAYHSVLFIDAGVSDAQALLAGTADDVLVVYLSAEADGVQQIAAALQGLEGLDSIQILSHGAVGQLQLGNGVLNAARLQDDAALLQQWGSALREGGDLLLYGCDVAQGSEGLAFIDALADLTGADVAASSDATGSSLLGANWILERSSGSIEAASALSQQAQQDYGHTLALVNNGAAGTITFNTNSDVSLLNASGLGPGAVVNVSNILNTGLDVYAQSSNGGGVSIVNANGTSVLGVPLNDDRLTVNGSLLSPVNYVDLRANSGVFDMVSLKLGSGNLVGNLLGTTVFTVYALDANYQPTGVGVSLLSLVVNEYGLLNFASMANFKGIYGVRIVNPLGFEVGIDDVQVANGRVAPSVSSAAYNAGTGVLSITTVGLTAGDAVDPSKLTISGQGGSYTLTSPAVAAASGTSVSITLNAADKLALGGVLNQAGASAVDGTVFNVAAAAGWTSNVSSAFDLTGNAITVSNVQLPTITSASYDATSHVLTVTGANLVKMVGAANDITVSQLVLRGEGGVTRTLSTTGNVEINSATSFSVTLSGADVAAITTLLNKNGTAAAGGATYQLSAGDDWNSVIGNANTAVAGVGVVVTNASNSAPTITGAAAASTGDNASLTPFANVNVADVNGDNVSLSISYNGANGTLSGAGLSGSAGSYTMNATTPAALSALLKALTFTPTANQAAVGVNIATTFSLTATDSNGAASAVNSATVVTATSVNDAPVLAGTAAGQGVTAGGTVRPFSAVTLSDPDVGASVILTITPDSASKGVFTPASLSASGFVTTDGGATYTHTAAAPGAAQAALQSLVFQTTPGMNATTTFTLSVNDGSVIVSNSSTTVQAAVPSATTALTVAFSNDTGVSNSDLITTAAAQNLSGTLSTGLLSGERVEVSLDNGVSWTTASASVGATSWQLAGQTLSGAGTLQVRVTNNGGSSTPLSASYKIDNTAPTTTNGGVSFLADTGNSNTDLVTRTAAQTVSGTLSANLAADEHVEVSFNNGSSWTTASASTGSSAWTLNGVVLSNGSNSLQVRVVDAAGNAGTANSTQYVLDTSGPSATLGTNVSVVGAGQAVPVTVSFTERPYGLTLASFNGVGGTVGNLQATADPLVYTIDYTPTAGIGNVVGSVQLVAGSYTDLAGNSGSGAVSQGVSVTLGPTVVITSDRATLNIGQSANLTFTFSSVPVGFTSSDIVVSGGALSGLTNLGNGIYTALFTPGPNVTGPASITVTGGSYTDILTLPGGSGVSPTIAIDTRAPTLAITSSASALKIGDTATITFTFSEAPLGFDATDVTVLNGALSGLAVTANPLVYTALLTPTNGVASGAVTVSVASGSYTDAALNSGGGSPSPSISIDTVAPAATGTGFSFSQDGGVSNTDLITNSAAQTISGTLGAPLASGDVVQVSLDNGLTWVNASASAGASSWSLAGQTLVAGPGQQLQVRVSDAAGNHSATVSTPYLLDTTAPSVAVASSAASLRVGESATLTFTFSEAPVNFTTASLSVSGGVVSALAATANPLVYTAQFTPAAGQAGASASIAVNGGGYSDTAGNSGQASAALPITLNTSVPTLVITTDDAALAVGETAQITFTFSSAPVGFVAGDVVVSNGVLSGLAATANPLVYTAQFTPTAGLNNASATVTVASGAYADAAGNLGNGAAVLPIAIDTLAPSVAITSSVAAVKAGETAQITFTFSEAPLGFTSSDVVTTGGVLSGLAVTGNPLVYTALFTPAAGIQNTSASITLAPGAFTDAAGNASVASVTPPLAIDTQAPTANANTVLFSNDTGASATDLITNTAAQTISGTVGTVLGAGEFVEVSLDNGANWASATTIGNAWTLAGQTLVASNVLQVRVSDAAGNHGAAFTRAYVLDTTAPTAAISASTGNLKSGETALVTFTFSEAPTGFTATDLTASGGTLSGFTATANPLVYTVVFTPTAGVNSGSGVVSINANSYQDLAGNNGGTASLPAIAIDTQAPTTLGAGVTFSADSGISGTDLITNVAAQTISGTLGASLVAGETVEVSLNNGLNWVAATASAGSNSWSLAGQTLSAGPGQQVQVRVSDAAGNHGAVVSTAYTLDQGPPTLTITTSKTGLNSADTPLITFTFSEAPQNFNAASIITGGGVLSGFTATFNPLVYTAVFTPTAGQASGVGTVQVSPGSYTDAAGNSGLGAAVAPISYATLAPGVSISSNVSALHSGETATITFRFSSAPTNFIEADVAVNGGTLSGFGPTGDPLVYTAQFTPGVNVAQGTGAISVASGSFTDSNGSAGVGGSMLPISIDTLAPTLAITSSASALNGGSTALITFTFSEAPATFTLGDIGVTNGSLSNLVQTANPAIYTAVLTPTSNLAGGNAVISVASGAYADLAGNAGGAGTGPSISVDTLAPTLANALLLFSNDTGNNTDRVTSIAAQNIAGDLAGGVLAPGDVVEVSLDNGASWQSASAAAGGTGWVLTGQTLANGSGNVQVRVSDSNGNHGMVNSYAYVLDTTAPTVSITSDSTALRAGQSATISFTFSEAPTGFTLGDLIATGGTLSSFTATANPLVYTVVLTPTPGLTGSASVTLGSGLYTDLAGNSGSGGSSPSITVDTVVPTLSIGASSSSLKAGDTATITFTFSDVPSGFSLADITASNGALSNLVASPGGLVYTATFTPAAGTASANAVISVAAGLYNDAAGNLGAGASSSAIAIDTVAPTNAGASVTFSADNGPSNTDLVTNAVAQTVSGTLDAPLAAGERVEVSLDNGATWTTALTTAPGQWALAPQVLTGSGTLQVRVADTAGNTGPVLAQNYVLDLTPPTVAVTSSASALRAGETATITFTFSEVPSGFIASDLTALNGTLSGFAVTADPHVYTVVLAPSAGLAGTAASVTLAPGRYTDLAGNPGVGATSPLITVDSAPPVLQITSSASSLRLGEQATINFTFSEAPVGFTVGDVNVTGGVLSGFGLTANPLVYTAIFTPTQGVSSGAATIGVAGGYTDAAGNPGGVATLAPITYNTQPPSTGAATVAFSSDTGISNTDLITLNAIQTISGTLNSPLAAGEIVEVSLDNGASWIIAGPGGVGADWALPTPTLLSGSGVVQVRVTDGVGNHGAVWSSSYTIDTTAPAVTIASSVAVLKAGDSATITFTFSEEPQGFIASDLSVLGGSITSFGVSADPRVYTAVFTPTPGYSGAASVSLAPATYTDKAGNAGLGGAVPAISVDALAPTLLITSSLAQLKAGDSALITFTFSEAPVGFAVGDVTVSGGTLSAFAASANPLVYTAVLTPTPGVNAGVASVSVAPAVYSDAAGNVGGAGVSPTINFDTLAPLAAASGSPTFSLDTGASATDLITSVAAQTVSGNLSLALAAGETVQVSFDNGATWQQASVSGTSWTLGHTLTGSGVLRVRVSDTAGNHSPDTVHAYAFDQSAPSVAITSNVPVANGVTPAVITFTFSEAPVGFSAANVAVSGGSLGAVTATSDPRVFTASFTPTSGVASGSASIAVTGGYTDLAGNNGGAASIPSLQIDTVAPVAAPHGGVQFSNDSGAAGDLVTNNPAQSISGTLNAPLAAGDVVQVSLNGGQTWIQATVNGLNWNLPGQTLPSNGSGTLVVRVADAAGNFSTAQSLPFTVDTNAPTVTISAGATTVAPGEGITVTFTLSDPGVLTAGNIVVSNGTLSNFSGSGTTYTAILTPSGTAAASISVPGQLFTDLAGNANQASAPLVVAVGPAPTAPGQSSTVDGVLLVTQSGIDGRTGMVTRTVTVPTITNVRNEDQATSHANLADIPLGIVANALGVGSTLTVSLPIGIGFEASGPAELLGGSMAMLDLIGRIDDHTAAGDPVRTAMEAQARQFLAGQGAGELEQHGTIRLSGVGAGDNTWLLVTGDTPVQGGTLPMGGNLAGASPLSSASSSSSVSAAATPANAEIALVIDARALSGAGIELDDVDFAAIIGGARVQGGAGQNFVIGDDAAQHITLTSGTENDTLYGNGGNDILGSGSGNDYLNGGDGNDILFAGAGNDVLVGGAGNDVLQGGRTDSGQWRFYLRADGTVEGVHQLALFDTTSTEIVSGAELNSGVAKLTFAGAAAARLENLSLLYHAAFDREPDLGGLSFWSVQNMSVQEYAAGFLIAPEAENGLMKLSNHDYVTTLLRNTLDRAPTNAELDSYVARLDAAPGAAARASVLADIALSAAHKAAWWTSNGMALGSELLTQEQGWIAGSGDDRLEAGSGANLLVGGDGVDTAVFTGAADSYHVVLSNTPGGAADVLIGQSADAMNTVRQIELGEFTGATRDLTFTQAASATLQEIGMLYQLTLDRAGDYAGFQLWLGSGLHGAALANGFTRSVEFMQRYGTLDDAAFVAQIYRNATNTGPDQAVASRWETYLETHSREEMVAQLAVDTTLVGIQHGTNGLVLIGSL